MYVVGSTKDWYFRPTRLKLPRIFCRCLADAKISGSPLNSYASMYSGYKHAQAITIPKFATSQVFYSKSLSSLLAIPL